MTEGCAAWVYATAATIPPAGLAGLAGVGGAPVHAVRSGGLAAAVSTVSLSEFGEEPLRRHLEDLAWLETTARAHHRVIETVLGGRPGVPMRLATIYHDDARVATMLAERRAEVTAALDRVAARAEWGVKLFAVPHRDVATPAAPDPGLGPGAGYLKRRQAELSAREDTRRAAAAAAGGVHAALARLASAAQLRPPQVAELAGAPETMVLNGTYLVEDARWAEFAAAARELASQPPGVRLELTGPWPPYSFTAVDLTGSDDPHGLR